MARDLKEANINFYEGDDTVWVTVYQGKYKNQIEKLAKEYPDEVKVIARNDNGTLYAKLDKKFVHLSFSYREKREMTEDQKEAARERMKLVQVATRTRCWRGIISSLSRQGARLCRVTLRRRSAR